MGMDILVKMGSFQIKQNVLNLKSTLARLVSPRYSVTRLVDNVYQVDILNLSVDKIFGNKNAIKTEFLMGRNHTLIFHEKMSLKQKFIMQKWTTLSHLCKKRKIIAYFHIYL